MGMILDIKKFAIHDGPGIRTTVFFKGCPLECWWCHNPESRSGERQLALRESRCIRCARCVAACSRGAVTMNEHRPVTDAAACSIDGACAEACPAEAREVVGREMTVGQVIDEVRKDLVFYEQSGGGVTFSGGEPLMQPEFLRELLEACNEESISTAVDTTGYAGPETFHQAVAGADLLLYDVKLVDDARHQQYCGVSNVTILDNLRALAGDGRTVVLRVPLVPGVNDDAESIARLGEFASSLPARYPIDLLPYERRGLHKYAMLGMECRMEDVRLPADGCVQETVKALRGFGLKVTVRGEADESE